MKGGTLANGAVLLLVAGMLAWLNGRPDSDHLRLICTALVLALALPLLWQGRHSLWRPPLVATLAVAALVLIHLTSPEVNLPVFEEFAGIAAGAGLVWLLAWIVIRVVLPRTDARYQALPIVILSGILSAALFVTSLGAWLKAVDLNALPDNSVAETGAELAAQWAQPWGKRYRGIFVVGTIGDPARREEGAGTGGDILAYHDGPRTRALSSGAIWLPLFYEMRLVDGALVQVAGISRVAAASAWPECGPRLNQRCLREGDPVVVWADPGASNTPGNGEPVTALSATRLIAHGSLEDFREGYLARAVATARIFGWIALALVPLSLVPALLGLRRARWLRRNGSDRVPKGGQRWIQ